MTIEQKELCHKIIHTAAAGAAAAGGGLAQLPGADHLVIIPLQLGMIEGLGKVFGISLLEASAKALLASCLATVGGRTISQFLVGWIPGVGNVINATTAATITEAIGWLAVKDFENRVNEIQNMQKALTDEQKKANDDLLKNYDTGLTTLIRSKKPVNETELTMLFTGKALPMKYSVLTICDKAGNSKEMPLVTKKTTIGRSDSSHWEIDINLAKYDTDKRVSRRHAVIYNEAGKYYLEDTGSSNGTYLNNSEIEKNKKYPLNNGDEICFGDTKGVFQE